MFHNARIAAIAALIALLGTTIYGASPAPADTARAIELLDGKPQPAANPTIKDSLIVAAVKWVTIDEARESPKPDFWFATDPVAGRCAPCQLAEKLFTDPKALRWLALFDCIKCHELPGVPVSAFPTYAFTSREWTGPNARYKRFVPGNPRTGTSEPTANDVCWRLHEAYNAVAN